MEFLWRVSGGMQPDVGSHDHFLGGSQVMGVTLVPYGNPYGKVQNSQWKLMLSMLKQRPALRSIFKPSPDLLGPQILRQGPGEVRLVFLAIKSSVFRVTKSPASRPFICFMIPPL